MDAQEFFGDWCEVIDFNILGNTLNNLEHIMMNKDITPAPELTFEAFRCCPYSNLKVVMLGQEPYPQKGIATGIAFGNKKDTDINNLSPSLKVLYDAVNDYCSSDLPFTVIDDVFPTLESWCTQGVLMLNSALTVEVGSIGSHEMLWRPFIKSLLTNLQKKNNGLIFVLLGDVAQSFKGCLNEWNVISCPHPSRCARTGIKFPDIFKEIDQKMLEIKEELIYWI